MVVRHLLAHNVVVAVEALMQLVVMARLPVTEVTEEMA